MKDYAIQAIDLTKTFPGGMVAVSGLDLQIERGTAYEALGDALAERGHILNFSPQTSGLHGIERVPGGWRGGADPRREGVARGD